jgi:hypothetical protein
MKIKLLLVMCLLLGTCGCGRKKTFQNTAFSGKKYTLTFPSTWEANDTGIMGTDRVGLSPLEDANDIFRENVTVVLENLPSSMTDQKYLDLTIKSLTKAFGLSEGVAFSKVRVGAQEGYHLRYAFQMGQQALDNDVYIVVRKGSAYILTCSNAKGKRDVFKPVMDATIASFNIE